MNAERRRLIIHGRVQGVGYRWWTVETVEGLARQGHAIRGWVRNRREGTVEILAEGTPAALDALAEACRQGPPAAMVGAVDMSLAETAETLGRFEQRPTA
jgi:acylphosphatase